MDSYSDLVLRSASFLYKVSDWPQLALTLQSEFVGLSAPPDTDSDPTDDSIPFQ